MVFTPRIIEKPRNLPFAAQQKSRPGSVYVAVLGVALIVAVVGLTSMHLERVELRAATTANDISAAQLVAESALEFALQQIQIEGDTWRSTFTSGQEVPSGSWSSLGSTGHYKFVLTDPDGDLNDDLTDEVTVKGIGRVGGATSVVAAKFVPTGEGISCLEAVLHSQGELWLLKEISGSGILSSNNDVNSSFGTTNLSVEAAGSISGPGFNGSTTSGVPPREMPDTAKVFEYYLNNGTLINFGSANFDKVVLTAGHNPFGSGTTNSEGIYIIDCSGNDLTIKNSRLQATLVVLNADQVKLENNLHWEPEISNYPALLVEGALLMLWNGTTPLEESNCGTNFNPVGAPYEGVSDTDQNDSYLPLVKGIVYCTGDLDIKGTVTMNGSTIVGGQCNIEMDAEFNYDAILLNNAPPGFNSGATMVLIPGSWVRTNY